MKYDFITVMDRRGKDSVAADLNAWTGSIVEGKRREGFDTIPMWVADMNFPTAPSVTNAMIERTKHPAFGYFFPRKEYYDSIIEWHRTRNGVEGILPEHIGYENGVLGGVLSALNIMTSKGVNVLLHSPTYVGFTGSLQNNGYNIIHSPLVLDENGVYRMDFEDMEKKIVCNNIHSAIFCSPHNPCG